MGAYLHEAKIKIKFLHRSSTPWVAAMFVPLFNTREIGMMEKQWLPFRGEGTWCGTLLLVFSYLYRPEHVLAALMDQSTMLG